MCINTYTVLFQSSHPHPGVRYQGLRVKAYLYDDAEGRKVMHFNNTIHCVVEHDGKQNIRE